MFLLLLTSLIAQAAEPIPVTVSENLPPFALVTKVTGDARFEGRKLSLNYRIDYPGTITTKSQTFLQVTIAKWNKKINIGPNSSMTINFKADQKYVFENGTCRWLNLKKAEVPGAPKGAIHTRNASLGIRGTDFLLRVNKDFGETELYLLEGEVKMDNAANKMDSAVVKAGQWMGVGGRFGDSLHGPIELAPDHLKRLKEEELLW